MPVFGLTPQGLKIKRLADIIADIQTDARSTFGTSVDLDARRPLGQFIGIIAERLSLNWELFEAIYNASFPRHAEGKHLDEVVSYNGLVRRPATYSTASVVLYGAFNTIVPKGTKASVQGSPESIFALNNAVTIGAGTNEIQKITFNSLPVDGSFTLDVAGEITAAIPFDISAAGLEQTLEDLPGVEIVHVTGNFTDGFTIEFDQASGERPWPLIVTGSNTLTSRTVHRIYTVADVNSSLMSRCFRFDDPDGAVGVFFDVGNTGAPTPPALAAITYRSIKVSTVNPNDSANTVATKLAAALAADPSVQSAVANTNQVRLELFDEFNLQALVDLNTNFVLGTTNVGRDIGELTISSTRMQTGAFPNAIGKMTAINTGPIAAPAGSLVVREDNVNGWTGITNPLDAEQGEDIESDEALKARRIAQFAKAGRSTPGAIRAKLLEVPGVVSATVRYNNKSVTEDGIPPKSVKAYVLGGEPADIGAMLYDSVAAGILTTGDETFTYKDVDGYFHEMAWSRPNLLDVYVHITVQKSSEDAWPADGTAAVKSAVLAYGETLGMGDDVVPYPRLISHLNILPSVIQGMDLRVGLAPNPVGSVRIEVDAQEIAVFDTSRITVTVEDI